MRYRSFRKYAAAICAASILVGVVWHAGQASAADTLKLRIGTELDSELPMTNLKPGDRVERTFTVANDGSIAFDYKVRTRFVSGDTEFFDVLELTVKDGDTVIYDGALHLQQQEIALGRLAAGGENELDLSVKFPEEAGNEYQGKAATIAFTFSAYAEEPSNGGAGAAAPILRARGRISRMIQHQGITAILQATLARIRANPPRSNRVTLPGKSLVLLHRSSRKIQLCRNRSLSRNHSRRSHLNRSCRLIQGQDRATAGQV